MSTAFRSQENASVAAGADTKCGASPKEVLAAAEQAANRQKRSGLGDPKVSLDRMRKRLRKQILEAQARELAATFASVKKSDVDKYPRAKSAETLLPELPDTVVCKLDATVDYVRCWVSHPIWKLILGKHYEAPVPVIPSTIQELAGRAKEICPEVEFHLVFKPSWAEVPQQDPTLLARVPETNQYFEIGHWDGDLAFGER